MLVDDPKSPFERLTLDRLCQSGHESKHFVRAGSSWPKNYDASVVAGLVGPDVGEVEIQRDQDPALIADELSHRSVSDPGGCLIEQGRSVMPGSSQSLRCSSREVLVELESHAASDPGSSTMRSRASSAA